MSQFVLAYRVPEDTAAGHGRPLREPRASRISEHSIAKKDDVARPTPDTRKERKITEILGSGVAEISRVRSYTGVVSTDDGESAFEDAELHLNEQQVADGVPAMFVGALGPAHGVAAFLRFAAEPLIATRIQHPSRNGS